MNKIFLPCFHSCKRAQTRLSKPDGENLFITRTVTDYSIDNLTGSISFNQLSTIENSHQKVLLKLQCRTPGNRMIAQPFFGVPFQPACRSLHWISTREFGNCEHLKSPAKFSLRNFLLEFFESSSLFVNRTVGLPSNIQEFYQNTLPRLAFESI